MLDKWEVPKVNTQVEQLILDMSEYMIIMDLIGLGLHSYMVIIKIQHILVMTPIYPQMVIL